MAPVTISPQLRELSIEELRDAQLRILDTVAEHCAAHGIRFYLCAGTLLGAVRHGGYIPWDDDVDLMFPRPDFERFCATFPGPVGVARFAVHSARTSPTYGLPFAKVCDTRTRLEVESDVVRDIGVYVDAFPLDGWLDAPAARRVQRAAIRALTALMMIKHLSLRTSRPGPRNAVLRAAKGLLRWLPARSISAGLTWVARRGDFDRCAATGVVLWGYHEVVPRTCYGEPSLVRFEGRDLPAPADTDGVLTRLYGDYLRLPPVDKRVTAHRFRAYSVP